MCPEDNKQEPLLFIGFYTVYVRSPDDVQIVFMFIRFGAAPKLYNGRDNPAWDSESWIYQQNCRWNTRANRAFAMQHINFLSLMHQTNTDFHDNISKQTFYSRYLMCTSKMTKKRSLSANSYYELS